MPAVLKVQNVTLTYGDIIAVADATLAVDRNEYVCLVGANGSGKSTLLRAILGLVPLRSGKIELSVSLDAIAYLPQVRSVVRGFPATVAEVVLTGTQKKKQRLPFYTRQDRASAAEAMDMLGISGLRNKRIGSLSGGQQQRVLLARALCRKPAVLILDEPFTGLDPQITADMYDLLHRLNAVQAVTIVMASHDLHEVVKYASRVIALNRSVIFDGRAEEWININERAGR